MQRMVNVSMRRACYDFGEMTPRGEIGYNATDRAAARPNRRSVEEGT